MLARLAELVNPELAAMIFKTTTLTTLFQQHSVGELIIVRLEGDKNSPPRQGLYFLGLAAKPHVLRLYTLHFTLYTHRQ